MMLICLHSLTRASLFEWRVVRQIRNVTFYSCDMILKGNDYKTTPHPATNTINLGFINWSGCQREACLLASLVCSTVRPCLCVSVPLPMCVCQHSSCLHMPSLSVSLCFSLSDRLSISVYPSPSRSLSSYSSSALLIYLRVCLSSSLFLSPFLCLSLYVSLSPSVFPSGHLACPFLFPILLSTIYPNSSQNAFLT